MGINTQAFNPTFYRHNDCVHTMRVNAVKKERRQIVWNMGVV